MQIMDLNQKEIIDKLSNVHYGLIELICDASNVEPLWTIIDNRISNFPEEPIIYIDQENHLPVSIHDNPKYSNLVFIGTAATSLPLFQLFESLEKERGINAFVIISSLPFFPRDCSIAMIISKIKRLADYSKCTVVLINDLRINIKSGIEAPFFGNITKKYVDVRADYLNGFYRVIDHRRQKESILTEEQQSLRKEFYGNKI